jgi:hypothetical protein
MTNKCRMCRFTLYLDRPIRLNSLPLQSRGQRLTLTRNAMDRMSPLAEGCHSNRQEPAKLDSN